MIFLRTLLISVVLLTAACDGEERGSGSEGVEATESEKALVVTSNYPLYFFATRITQGVDAAPEIVLPDIDGDPALWIPSAEQIQLLQSADIIFLNGAGAEPWLNLISIDRRRLVDTSLNIADRLLPLEDSMQHQHGPEGEHSHQGTAFTTWLDPELAIVQARAVTDALIEVAPKGEAALRDNMEKLEQNLMALDAQLAEVFAKLAGRPVLFSHPVYQYLQRHYNINGISVHWETDEEPSMPDWIELQQILASHPATIMIWEDQPLHETVERLVNAGIRSIPFHTAVNPPDEGDYLSVMRESANRLELFLD